MTIAKASIVPAMTGGFWDANPDWLTRTTPWSGNFMYAAYSSTAAAPTNETRYIVADYVSSQTGGSWEVGSAVPSLPSETIAGHGSWAYGAYRVVTTTVVPTDWPSGWTMPGPPWPPGWPRAVTGAITCEVTAPATVIYANAATVSVSFFNPALTPAVVCLGEVCRISATLDGNPVNIKKSGGTYASTLDYVMSLYDAVNYGISESITAETTVADVGKTIQWTAQSMTLATNASNTADTIVIAGCP